MIRIEPATVGVPDRSRAPAPTAPVRFVPSDTDPVAHIVTESDADSFLCNALRLPIPDQPDVVRKILVRACSRNRFFFAVLIVPSLRSPGPRSQRHFADQIDPGGLWLRSGDPAPTSTQPHGGRSRALASLSAEQYVSLLENQEPRNHQAHPRAVADAPGRKRSRISGATIFSCAQASPRVPIPAQRGGACWAGSGRRSAELNVAAVPRVSLELLGATSSERVSAVGTLRVLASLMSSGAHPDAGRARSRQQARLAEQSHLVHWPLPNVTPVTGAIAVARTDRRRYTVVELLLASRRRRLTAAPPLLSTTAFLLSVHPGPGVPLAPVQQRIPPDVVVAWELPSGKETTC